ncbi:MAG: hypothetical protein ACLGSA_15480 [Acidobacteriota bacterium]
MTKYHKFTPAVLAALLMCATAGQAQAGPLDEAFAPRPVPGLAVASLEVPVQPASKAAPAPAQELAAPTAPEPEKGFWDRTREFFGF